MNAERKKSVSEESPINFNGIPFFAWKPEEGPLSPFGNTPEIIRRLREGKFTAVAVSGLYVSDWIEENNNVPRNRFSPGGQNLLRYFAEQKTVVLATDFRSQEWGDAYAAIEGVHYIGLGSVSAAVGGRAAMAVSRGPMPRRVALTALASACATALAVGVRSTLHDQQAEALNLEEDPKNFLPKLGWQEWMWTEANLRLALMARKLRIGTDDGHLDPERIAVVAGADTLHPDHRSGVHNLVQDPVGAARSVISRERQYHRQHLNFDHLSEAVQRLIMNMVGVMAIRIDRVSFGEGYTYRPVECWDDGKFLGEISDSIAADIAAMKTKTG